MRYAKILFIISATIFLSGCGNTITSTLDESIRDSLRADTKEKHITIIIGQSNAGGSGKLTDLTSEQINRVENSAGQTVAWYNNKYDEGNFWALSTPYQTDLPRNEFGLELPLMMESDNLVISMGSGGSRFDEWASNESYSNTHLMLRAQLSLLDQVKALEDKGYSVFIDTIIMWIGESTASDDRIPNNQKFEHLERFIYELKTICGRDDILIQYVCVQHDDPIENSKRRDLNDFAKSIQGEYFSVIESSGEGFEKDPTHDLEHAKTSTIMEVGKRAVLNLNNATGKKVSYSDMIKQNINF